MSSVITCINYVKYDYRAWDDRKIILCIIYYNKYECINIKTIKTKTIKWSVDYKDKIIVLLSIPILHFCSIFLPKIL